jgi:hypothetical protein
MMKLATIAAALAVSATAAIAGLACCCVAVRWRAILMMLKG